MGSPFSAGRDSNVPGGNSFDAEPDVMAMDAGDFTAEAMHTAANRLNEEDYRMPENKW